MGMNLAIPVGAVVAVIVSFPWILRQPLLSTLKK
jgi:hypothetical protein